MRYLSKGTILATKCMRQITVRRCDADYKLTAAQSRVWLCGRFEVCEVEAGDGSVVKGLSELGLVEAAEGGGSEAAYRILAHCILCKAKLKTPSPILNKDEAYIWKWVDKSGYMLSPHELVYLMEHQVSPERGLLGKGNWHALIEKIYSVETICDGVLMAKMEHSPARDRAVNALLGLLCKRRLIIV